MSAQQQQQHQMSVQEQQQMLRDLLAKGRKNGKLSLKEIADALQSLELESEDIDKLYETIENMGIAIEGADVLAPALSDDEDFEVTDVEEVTEEELVDTSALAEGFAIDDPVRMYLKEIGKVDLLSPDEELRLADQMTAGAEAIEAIRKLEADRKMGIENPMTPEQEKEYRKAIKVGDRAKKRPSGCLDCKALCRTRDAVP